MTFIRRFFDPGPGSGFGPSLGDILDNGVESDGITLKPGWQRNDITGAVTRIEGFTPPAPPTPPTPPTPPAPPVPGAVEGLNDDGTLQEGYIKDATGNVIKDPNYTPPAPQTVPETEALNADGSLKEGFIKNADGTYAIDPNYEVVEDDETGMKFIAAVENITGVKYEVQYPEGVHPTSPEGVATREKFIYDRAQQDFDTYLKSTDPRSYAYMLHRAAGKPDEEFFGDNNGFQLPTEADMRASADRQAEVYTQDLLSKGLDSATAKALVDLAIKDNSLETKASTSWKAMDAAQKKQLEDLEKIASDKEKVFNTNLAALNTAITDTIKKEISFVVPEAEMGAFQQYILDNTRYDNGKFFTVQEIGKDNMKVTLESLFFQYKKGNLEALVRKQAATKAAQGLRLKLKDTGKGPGSGSGIAPNNTNNLPLSAILPASGQA